MDLEAASWKRREVLVLGFTDAYNEEMADSKEGEIDKDAVTTAELRFRALDVGGSIKSFFGSREVGEFVSGALAGAMTKVVLAPLETIRDLSFNNLSGSIPARYEGLIGNLTNLYLTNNKFTGTIPSWILTSTHQSDYLHLSARHCVSNP